MSSVQEIQDARTSLIASIRMYSESQVDLWRLVPWLALQADGRDGGIGTYERVYAHGLWALEDSGGIYATCVDCDTGRLVRLQQSQLNRYAIVPALDYSVFSLANKLGKLDAADVISVLMKAIESPRKSWISEEEAANRDCERAELASRYGVKQIYVRPTAAQTA